MFMQLGVLTRLPTRPADEEDDHMVPDREEDMKPQHAKSRQHQVSGMPIG
jgi:hypothetical protein